MFIIEPVATTVPTTNVLPDGPLSEFVIKIKYMYVIDL